MIFYAFVECKWKVFEVVPESKEGEANKKTQRSAKVRYHRYKIIIVNLKSINRCYIVVIKCTPSGHQVMFIREGFQKTQNSLLFP